MHLDKTGLLRAHGEKTGLLRAHGENRDCVFLTCQIYPTLAVVQTLYITTPPPVSH